MDRSNLKLSKHEGLSRALAWVWHDGVLRYWKQTLGIAATSTLAVALQAAAFGWVYAYAARLQAARPLEGAAGAFEALLSQPMGGPIAASIAVLVLLGISGLADYLSFRGSLRLRREYEELIVQRVLHLASRLPGPGSHVSNAEMENGSWIGLKRKGARVCGRSLAILTQQITPALRGVLACVVMAYIHAGLAAIVMAATATLLFALQHLFRAATNRATQADALAEDAAIERKRLSHRVEVSATPLPATDGALRRMFKEGAVASYHDAFFQRYVITGQSRLAALGLVAVLLIAMVVAAGGVSHSPQWNWASFFVFLVALRLAVGDFTRMAQSVGRITRYAEQVARVATFIEDASSAPATVARGSGRFLELEIPALEGDGDSLRLEPGERYLLVTNQPPGRQLVAVLHSHLPESQRSGLADLWVLGDVDLLGTTLRQGLGFPEDLSSEQLHAELRVALREQGHEVNGIPDLDEELKPDTLAALDDDSWLALKLLAAEHSHRLAILLRRPELERFQALLAGTLARIAAERALVIVHKELPPEHRLERGLEVLVGDGCHLVGHCTTDDLLQNPSLRKRVDDILSEPLPAPDPIDVLGDDDP